MSNLIVIILSLIFIVFIFSMNDENIDKSIEKENERYFKELNKE